MKVSRSPRMAVLAILAMAGTAMLLTAPDGQAARPATSFTKPLRLTSTPFGGYEPGIKIDSFGNIFITAHKQNFIDAAAPDANAPTEARSASWLWTSADGMTFRDLPGVTPLSANNLEFGDEGDLALDQAGHLLFIDTNVADVAVTRWSIAGPGELRLDGNTPAIGSAQPLDDRPWIASTPSRDVAYVSNEGDKVTYRAVAQRNNTQALGPGRDTVYMSHDGGATFDHLGVTLRDSGWCKPTADARPGQRTLYVICTNDSGANDITDNPGGGGYYRGTLYCYRSLDAGNTWTRYVIGNYDGLTSATYPDVAVGPDGTVRALFVDPRIQDSGQEHDVLELWTSYTAGRSWTRETIPTPDDEIPYSALALGPHGDVHVAEYSRPHHSGPWYVYAQRRATATGTWQTSRVTNMPIAPDSGPYGDFFQIAVDPRDHLNVVWTVVTSLGSASPATEGSDSDIYYAREQ